MVRARRDGRNVNYTWKVKAGASADASMTQESYAGSPDFNNDRAAQLLKNMLHMKPEDVAVTEEGADLGTEKDPWIRSRLCSISTGSDVSGSEHRSSSPDSQCGLSELEPTAALPISPPPPYPYPEQAVANRPAQDAQMRSAHVEAVLSAVLLGDASRRSNRCGANEWLAKSTPPMSELSCVERCVQELNKIVGESNVNWHVLPFGSHVSGLALLGSDLDASLLMPESSHEDPGGANAVHTLKWVLRPLLKKHPGFQVTEQILNARVPLIKLRFEDSLDVDLSVHNRRPLENTGLIKAYVQMQPVVRELILAVKLWAKAAGVCGASEGKLSSYSFSLMAIYYMQVDPLVSLPCLNPAAFDLVSDKPPGTLHSSWSGQVPLSVLLDRFFIFYAEIFAWGEEVVSVRLGQRGRASDAEFSQLRHRSSHRIHIEDPYDLQRNLQCVLGREEEHDLLASVTEASRLVKEIASTFERLPIPQKPVTLKRSTQAPKEIATEEDHVQNVNEAPHVQTPESSKTTAGSPAAETQQDLPTAASVHLDDDEMRWWFAFVGSCCVYTMYAMYSGQLFRLGIALSALIMILVSIDQRLNTRGVAAADSQAPEAGWTTEAEIRRAQRKERHSRKHRNSLPPEPEAAATSSMDPDVTPVYQ